MPMGVVRVFRQAGRNATERVPSSSTTPAPGCSTAVSKTTPWSTYSLAQAKTGLGPKVHNRAARETPGRAAAFGEKTGTGIDAGLFFVNSKGNSDFSLKVATDVRRCSMLLRPAAPYLIHLVAPIPGLAYRSATLANAAALLLRLGQ